MIDYQAMTYEELYHMAIKRLVTLALEDMKKKAAVTTESHEEETVTTEV